MRNIYVIPLALIFLSCQPKQVVSGNSKPNIVLIMADDMGYECLGVNGSIEYQTPNLDRLAGEGIRFVNTYSQPLCTPSRVKIMTGQHNFRNYEDFGFLNPNQTTFGNLMKEAGYKTCIAGKWQLNGLNTGRPDNQDLERPYHFGFDEYCLWQLNHARKEGERFANPLITQNGKDLPRDPEAYGPQIFTNYINDFIDRNADQPFFVYYPMVLVHNPFVPTPDSPEWQDPARRDEQDTAFFADMMAYTDKLIGQIEAKLKSKGIWENTIFIFTADNGTNVNVFSNTTYGKIHGAKGYSINTGNHVPMIAVWPERIKNDRVFEGLIDFADVLPTLAEAAGIDLTHYKNDGKSFFPVLARNAEQTKDEVFIHYTPRWGKFEHNRWVLNGQYKLYQDGRFYHTSVDALEQEPMMTLTPTEQALKDEFERIIQLKEKEVPFSESDESLKL